MNLSAAFWWLSCMFLVLSFGSLLRGEWVLLATLLLNALGCAFIARKEHSE